MRALIPSLTIVVLSAVVLAQGTLTGQWERATNGGAKFSLDLVAKDTALTGTLTRNAETTKIADGKVSKNTFTFKATFGDGAESLAGEFTGDEMKIWLERQGPTNAIVLKRLKK